MLKVKVKNKNERIKEVLINGHANFDDGGKDIVCAAVSSIVITTVNAIVRIDKDSIEYDENALSITVLNENDIVNTLLVNMISLLKELENSYPKNIKFL